MTSSITLRQGSLPPLCLRAAATNGLKKPTSQESVNSRQAMQELGTRHFVFFSTDMTYGVPQTCPVPPDHPQRPLGPYGRSKVEAERLIRQASAVRATIFRPRLITGPGRLGIFTKLFN